MTMNWMTSMDFASNLSRLVCGLALSSLGCDQVSGISPSASVSYTPPLSPITLSWDSRGELAVSGTHGIVTPLGLFELGAHASIPPEEDGLLVILQDRRLGTEKVFRVRGSAEWIVETPDRVRISGRRILIEVDSDAVRPARLIPKTGRTPPMGIRSLAGKWRSTEGDVIVVVEQGNELLLTVVASAQFEWGTACLIRSGLRVKGDVVAVFTNDPTRTLRSAVFEGRIESPDEISGWTERITLDPWGRELARRPWAVRLRRIQ